MIGEHNRVNLRGRVHTPPAPIRDTMYVGFLLSVEAERRTDYTAPMVPIVATGLNAMDMLADVREDRLVRVSGCLINITPDGGGADSTRLVVNADVGGIVEVVHHSEGAVA